MDNDLRNKPDRTLSFKRVRELTDLSRTTVWRMQKVGQFPLPIQISPGRVGWLESEVLAWRATRLRGELPVPTAAALRPERPSRPQTAPVVVASEPNLEASRTSVVVSKPRRRPVAPSTQQLAFGF